MKLLSITCDPTCAGSGQSLALLLKELKSRGHDVLAVLPAKGDLSEKLEEYGVDYTINPHIKMRIWPICESLKDKILFIPRLIYWRFSDVLAFKKLHKDAVTFKPDIIHSNVSVIRYGYDLAEKLNIRHIWHIREYGDKDFNFKTYPTKNSRIKLLKKTPAICISRQLQDEYKLYENCEVIYNGIRSKTITHINNLKQPFFLFLGQVTVRKGILDLMEAYIKYKQNNGRYSLKIVGPISKKIKKILSDNITKSGLENDVEIIGSVRNVDHYLSQASALIVPSKYEAFGRVVGEAAFNGCLIIGRDSGGIKEQLDNGEKEMGNSIGLRFTDNRELETLLYKIEKIDERTLYSIIQRAQLYAKNYLSTEASADKVSEFILKILQ